ncbi:hypothetical protein [Flexithrix dorotheae]|uniref:hypothetical protein n=1 Tax=Flexithrix dorotheae TaxID=70993 RepID=UPI00036E342F|nr:hypothetical protein [Flexithrix dorotheae]
MNTLKNHVIVYDEECPMCQLYTGAFIKTEMLDKNGRIPYHKLMENPPPQIDMHLACNEIALINTDSQEVTYGKDSLFKIIGNSFPIFQSLFANKIFRFGIDKVYAFISLNRKVIAPGKHFEEPNSCTPDFSLTYRWLYIGLVWLFISWIVGAFAQLLVHLVSQGSFRRELLICGGPILWQGALMFFLKKDRIVHYLGNMMTVSLIGAVLLIPAILAGSFYPEIPQIILLAYFCGVVSFMLIEHMRRVKILEIHWIASLSWVLYRVFVLMIILL